MPDIAMCGNDDCPLARQCYRHEAPPDGEDQTYGNFAPDAAGDCTYFVGIGAPM